LTVARNSYQPEEITLPLVVDKYFLMVVHAIELICLKQVWC
jgi:hypothetical protein